MDGSPLWVRIKCCKHVQGAACWPRPVTVRMVMTGCWLLSREQLLLTQQHDRKHGMLAASEVLLSRRGAHSGDRCGREYERGRKAWQYCH
jgi:hypothetical protein